MDPISTAVGMTKAVADAIKTWRESGDRLYQLVAGVVAPLVVVAAATGARPSEAVAALARSLGLSSLAAALTRDAPPYLAATSPRVSAAAMSAVLVLFAMMVIVPLWRGRRAEGVDFFEYQLRLVGSRVACTAWLLMLAAAQSGDIRPVLVGWWDAVGNLTNGAMVVACIVVALALLAYRADYPYLQVALLFPGHLLLRVCSGAVTAVGAVVLAGASLPVALVAWLVALEPDRRARRASTADA